MGYPVPRLTDIRRCYKKKYGHRRFITKSRTLYGFFGIQKEENVPYEKKFAFLSVDISLLETVSGFDKECIMLEGAGHFPIEQPGLKQLEVAVLRF